MEHIDNLVRELKEQAHYVTESDTTESGIGDLLREAATQIATLSTALEDANGMCRSAMAIAERGGEANWPAFRERLHRSLKRQHAAMFTNDPIKSRQWYFIAPITGGPIAPSIEGRFHRMTFGFPITKDEAVSRFAARYQALPQGDVMPQHGFVEDNH